MKTTKWGKNSDQTMVCNAREGKAIDYSIRLYIRMKNSKVVEFYRIEEEKKESEEAGGLRGRK